MFSAQASDGPLKNANKSNRGKNIWSIIEDICSYLSEMHEMSTTGEHHGFHE
jgi:hypothetical protein